MKLRYTPVSKKENSKKIKELVFISLLGPHGSKNNSGGAFNTHHRKQDKWTESARRFINHHDRLTHTKRQGIYHDSKYYGLASLQLHLHLTGEQVAVGKFQYQGQ